MTNTSTTVFRILSELSQAITASLDLDATLQAILEGVERIRTGVLTEEQTQIPADIVEITVWKAEENQAGSSKGLRGYLIPYRFMSLPEGGHRLEKSNDRYYPGQGYSGYLIDQRLPLLVPDVTRFPEVQLATDAHRLNFQSYLGVPLIMAGELIGTLELASYSKESFNQGDLEVLQIISGQAAAALHNALLYEAEQQRARELAGLANLAQAISALRDPQDLFARLIESISPLLDVEVLGFLVFDENRRLLEGQVPFVGVPPDLVEWYRVPIQPGSPGEQVLNASFTHVPPEPIVSTSAPEDPRLVALGLQHLAQTAGIHDTVLMPLTSGGRILGYLQAGDKRDGTAFDQDDLRLLAIIASQAAPIIENSSLMLQARKRALRAETMRRIASLTGSMATLNETLKYGLLDLARLLQADLAAIFQVDQDRDELHLHPDSLFSAGQDLEERLKAALTPAAQANPSSSRPLPLDTWLLHNNAAGSPQAFMSGDLRAENQLPPLCQPLVESLKIRSVIEIPLVANGRGFGELLLASLKTDWFESGDMLSAVTAAGQLASAIEMAGLRSQNGQGSYPPGEQPAAQAPIQHSLSVHHALEIIQAVSQKASRAEVLLAFGHEILTRLELDTVLVVETAADEIHKGPTGRAAFPVEPRLLRTLGTLPEGVNPEALLGQRNPVRQVLQSGEMLLWSDLDQDAEWERSEKAVTAQPQIALARAPLLQALGAKAFICLPICAGNRAVAAVLGISRAPLPGFSLEMQQLYALLSSQVASALQNLDFQKETARRLREVNVLLDFSRHLDSLEPAKILQTLLESALSLLPSAQAGTVLRWDAQDALLVPQAATGYPDSQGLLGLVYRPGEGLAGQVFEKCQPVRIAEVSVAVHYNLAPEQMLRYRDATAGSPPVSSLGLPIGGSGGSAPSGVLVLDNFEAQEAFSVEDQALIASLTQQTALALENASLYQASRQRAQQLQALASVASAITSSLRTGELITRLLDQLGSVLPYDTGTLWLRNESASDRTKTRTVTVRAARGFADSEQRLGLSVALEDSLLLNEMITTGHPISVGNIQADPRFPTWTIEEGDSNLLPPLHLPYLSWLGVPLIASGEVMGVIALEKTEPNFYTPEHIQAATTFAGQAAVGLENASLFEQSVGRNLELDQRSQRLGMLNRLSQELSSSLDIDQILGFVLNELARAVPCSSASAILFNAAGQAILQAERPSPPSDLPMELPDAPFFDRLRQSLGVFNFELSEMEPDLAPLSGFLSQHGARSMLAVPLASGISLYGVLLALSDAPHRFDADEMELARTISNQAAIAVQNARLFDQTRSLTEDLERRVQERTTELAREHHRTETLLRIITELSASLDLDQVLSRTLRVLNDSIDAEQITVLIVRPGEKNLYRLASSGYTEPAPSGGEPTGFQPGQGLAGWVLANHQPVLVDDVLQDPRWIRFKEAPQPQHRSALVVPLMIGAEALGTLLLFHHLPAHFSMDQLELVQAAANQVAVAVNNAELYRLIRDQAEDLGSMLRNQQVETSRSQAILEAVADGVLVTDSSRKITLFNASAEKILGLDRAEVLGNSLDHFTGLFGRAASSWREKINFWSQDPDSFLAGRENAGEDGRPGETSARTIYAEQITLENGRVVSIHLAPVSLRNSFLGTVSIFQDITHQVEVDRLKSEFVATVSHELRTPMTSIKGYVEVLLMGAAGALGAQERHFLEIVKANTERLAVLVNDLLDISRIEAGRVLLSMQALNLEQLADEALVELSRRSRLAEKPVKIEKDIPPDLPRVLGDFDRVRQILDNLLDNAYNYNLPGGSILVRMRSLGEEVRIEIQDTGLGIPLAEQPHIFERFYRGESPLVLGVSGTGLGLSIVRNLVQIHHGRIWLEKSGTQGEGSTFCFTLPVYVAQEADLASPVPQKETV